MPHKLYMTVTLKRTEAGIKPRGYTANESVSNHGTSASAINVADLIANVKDDTGYRMCQVNIGKLPFQTTKQKIQPQR